MSILIVLAIVVILVLIALKLALSKEGDAPDNPETARMIHMSGIYSIVRGSPRESLAALRPKESEMREYLETVKTDIDGNPLSASDKTALLAHWQERTEANLRAIEKGDERGVSFYYYDYADHVCPVCRKFILRGNFVTREEIHSHAALIPPLHIGCACALRSHDGGQNLRDTTIAGMLPFFENDTLPPLPEWTAVVSLSTSAENV